MSSFHQGVIYGGIIFFVAGFLIGEFKNIKTVVKLEAEICELRIELRKKQNSEMIFVLSKILKNLRW